MKTAEVILNFYFRRKTDASLETKIQEWLAGDHFREEKEKALEKIWNEWVEYSPKPGRYAFESLDRMRVRLGFLPSAPVRRRRIPFGQAIAGILGALFLLVALGGVLYLTKRGAVEESAAVGESRSVVSNDRRNRLHVVLPDGSQAWLGHDSTIEWPDDFLKSRTIRLQGEAYFAVERQGEMPFTVEGDRVAVTVLGTEFLVRAYESEPVVEVTLARGSVEVTAGSRSVRMEPNERLVFDRRIDELTIRTVDPDDIAPWMNLDLEFENVPLREVFDRLMAYYSVCFTIDERIPLDTTIRVRFHKDEFLEEVLYVIKNTMGFFDFTIDGDQVILESR